MPPRDLKDIFGKFTGREVPLQDRKEPDPAAPYGYPLQHVVRRGLADETDPTVAEMKAEAEAHGFRLRLHWEEREFYADKPDSGRVTAEIERGPDGKWRVEADFRLE